MAVCGELFLVFFFILRKIIFLGKIGHLELLNISKKRKKTVWRNDLNKKTKRGGKKKKRKII